MALVVNGQLMRQDGDMPHGHQLRVLWPEPMAPGEYLAAVFRVNTAAQRHATGDALRLCMLKVMRVTAKREKVRSSYIDAAALDLGGTFGFVVWHVPSGRTLTSRRVFAQTEQWSPESFENKAPNIARVVQPTRFYMRK